jgi:hypothetical protein
MKVKLQKETPRDPSREQADKLSSKENPEAGRTRSERHTILSRIIEGPKTPNPGRKNLKLGIQTLKPGTRSSWYASNPDNDPKTREGGRMETPQMPAGKKRKPHGDKKAPSSSRIPDLCKKRWI